MDWFGGRVSLGNLDLAGAVNKLSESVKNIEKNFDNALGLDDKPESSTEGQQNSAADEDTLSDPSNSSTLPKETEASELPKDGEITTKVINSEADNDAPKMTEIAEVLPSVQEEESDNVDSSVNTSTKVQFTPQEGIDLAKDGEESANIGSSDARVSLNNDPEKPESSSNTLEIASSDSSSKNTELAIDENISKGDLENSKPVEASAEVDEEHHVQSDIVVADESHIITGANDNTEKNSEDQGHIAGAPVVIEASTSDEAGNEYEVSRSSSASIKGSESQNEVGENSQTSEVPTEEELKVVQESISQEATLLTKTDDVPKEKYKDGETDVSGDNLSSEARESDHVESAELEKVKRDLKLMEAALHGAARQSQAKADEIARLMNENEDLKAMIEDLRRKTNDAEIESLREEYHQRVATLERKVYALTKERDTLRREQNKKSDAAALLKEKDEIINQIMAEGEELSKKQASQEGQIRKLRAQVRELEEEKKGLLTKLQVEENKVESIKKDKGATEKLLQETIEKHQAELTVQKEYYTSSLNAAKEAEALAEARVNNEARSELESRLRETSEREAMLVQALEELRQTLSRQEQQAAFREDMLRRDMEDLQIRYQASERRCEELITQVPESTRPLLRQIEAMQETTARRAEAWAAVERTLNSRLQEAEAKAAGAEEKERSMNERLSQTLSRINVLEAQISCLRAEQTQLTRSLEKERQRAAEHRQEYLAAKEEFDTLEGRSNQLDEELRELKKKHKQELQESVTHRELLQQDLERERTARLELERTVHAQSSDKPPMSTQSSALENGKLTRKLSSASSVGNVEESFFLQASLDSSSDTYMERRNSGEITMNPYYLKSMTPSTFEATLRQKEGELASYMSRLASMESIRDSLAEELVKMTEQCEKLRTEAATLPGIRAELDALRRRHAAALELMGERDEELEELRADIVDLKEMYREQVNMLVNKIQVLSTQIGSG